MEFMLGRLMRKLQQDDGWGGQLSVGDNQVGIKAVERQVVKSIKTY